MTESTDAGRDDELGTGIEPADADEADTTGHSMGNYEFVRQEARERSRESSEWARKQGVRRESRGLIDRLRGR